MVMLGCGFGGLRFANPPYGPVDEYMNALKSNADDAYMGMVSDRLKNGSGTDPNNQNFLDFLHDRAALPGQFE